jgi:hypothetical protein
MPASFACVSQHRDDPDRLLLLGEDGRLYAYPLPNGPALPVVPDAEEWAVEPDLPSANELFG